jgi:hypothetical protein
MKHSDPHDNDIVGSVLDNTLDALRTQRDKIDAAIKYLEKLTNKIVTTKEKKAASSTAIEKSCEKCNVIKPATEFFRDKRTADGLSCMCQDCRGNKSV